MEGTANVTQKIAINCKVFRTLFGDFLEWGLSLPRLIIEKCFGDAEAWWQTSHPENFQLEASSGHMIC
jgi:hypothetical protein